MEIFINNFRSIEKKNYKFDVGNNLITGDSGIGKSTILESIIWCFYGGSNISPFNKKKIITKVEIKLNNITFIRTKPPDKCCVILQDKKLEFDEAQEYIYNYFGTRSLWETSSYLKQDTRSNLLFHSSQEKYSLIKEIVFGREEGENSPEMFLKKLNEFQVNLEKENLVLEGKLDAMEEDIKHLISNFEDFSEIENKQKRLSKIFNKYESIKDGVDKINKSINIQNEMKDNKIKLEEYKIKIEDYPVLTIEIIEHWKKWILFKNKLECFDKNFKEINDQTINIIDLETEVKILEKNCIEHQNNLKKCQQLGVIYSEEAIAKKISDLENNIKNIKKYEEYSRIMENVHKINIKIEEINKILYQFNDKDKIYFENFTNIMKNLKIDGILEFNQENVEKINNILNNIMTNYLNCPACKEKLVMEEGELIIKKCRFMKKEDIEKFKKNIKNISNFYQKKNQYELELANYIKIKNDMNIPVRVEKIVGNVRELENLIRKLREIKFIECNKEEIKEKKEFLINYNKTIEFKEIKDMIEKNYNTIFDNYPVPKDFSSYFREYQNLTLEIEKINSCLENKKEENIEDLLEKKKKLEDAIEDLDKFKVFLEIDEKRKKVNELKEENKALLKKREGCSEIKKIINEESASTFENLIGNFNDSLNEIVGEIFEDININLGMFKKLKAKGELKPQFNMKVMLKGNEYDNLNFLSGGEKDRISIALTLTLSTLLNNPIIMFDESMSSLDEEMRERCLELIKKYASDKILINICHSTIEGYYDNIIRL